MGVLLTVIIAAIVAYLSYLIALALPFLANLATIVGLIVFVLVLFGGWNYGWRFPNRPIR